jgi:ferredoxin
MFSVMVKNTGVTLTVAAESTILHAALAAGVAYPHGCKAGRCGGCKSRLIAGEVDMLPHTRFALTDEEKAHGLILACRARPLSPCEVEWLGRSQKQGVSP